MKSKVDRMAHAEGMDFNQLWLCRLTGRGDPTLSVMPDAVR
jgi:hypothetical protein